MTQKSLTQKYVGNEPMHQMSESKACMRRQSGKGCRVIGFAMTRRVVVGSTLFRLKSVLVPSWGWPEFLCVNQTDHIMTDSSHTIDITLLFL